MMIFRCKECGEVFNEPARWEEDRGEFWGVPCHETMYGCPSCKGWNFDEVDEDELDLEEEEEDE